MGPRGGLPFEGQCLAITDIEVSYVSLAIVSLMTHTSILVQHELLEPTAVVGGPRATGGEVLQHLATARQLTCCVTALSGSPKEVTVSSQHYLD
jgi:hypothetical protein